jgi:hypothetical protein
MVQFPSLGIIHYEEPELELKLLSRKIDKGAGGV